MSHPYRKARPILFLTEVLNNCLPALKILSFEDLIISNHLDCVNPTDVKTLSFNRVTLPFGADAYIAHHFPKLSKFKLKVCKTQLKKFNLPPIRLSTFHYTDIPHYRKIRIFTLYNGEQSVYHAGFATTLSGFDKELKGLLSPAATLPLDEGRSTPDFVFVCHSLKSFALT